MHRSALAWITEVERHESGARLEDGEISRQQVDAAIERHAHEIVRRDSARTQIVRPAVGVIASSAR